MSETAKYGTATILYTSLFNVGSRDAKVNPTIAAGDAQISKDGGNYANLATLPDLTPASLDNVRIQLAAAELQCKVAIIRFKDQTAPSEWDEQRLSIITWGHASAYDIQSFEIKTQTDKMNFDGIASNINANIKTISSTNQTGRDIGASVLLSPGTGTGQLDVTSGVVKSNMTQIDGVAASATKLSASANTMISGTVTDVAFAPTKTVFEASDITDPSADHYINRWLIFKTGTLIRQAKPIIAYSLVSGRGRFTCQAFTGAPANADTFEVV